MVGDGRRAGDGGGSILRPMDDRIPSRPAPWAPISDPVPDAVTVPVPAPASDPVADLLDGEPAAQLDYGTLLTEAERVLDEVDHALARLDDGTYGSCEVCGSAIGDDRLESAADRPDLRGAPSAGHAATLSCGS